MLRSLGVEVSPLPYELHPEIPAGGLSLQERWGARYAEAATMYARIEAECSTAGLPFRRPDRVPNTRRVLETAELVRRRSPSEFLAFEQSVFEAHFIDGRPIDDPDVVDSLVSAAAADAGEVRAAVDAGEAAALVDQAMARAWDLGVTATPTWVLEDRLVIPGVQSRHWFEDVVERMGRRREG